MFTTNSHIYLYIAGGIFILASLLYALKRKTAGFLALMAGLMLYTLYLAGRGWITGVFIPNNMFDAPFFFAWCFGILILLHRIFSGDDRWGALLVPLLLFTLVAVWHTKGIIPITPNKQTLWAPAFFITETLAHACFYGGAAFALVNLTGKNSDETFHAYVVWGFVLYCIAQVTGAVWCYYGWGNTFQWVSKHMGSTAIWLFYAGYIHIRFIAGWSGVRRSWYALAAAIISLVINASYYIKELSFPRIGG